MSDTKPGYTRKLERDHFVFFDQKGNRVKDADEVARIRALAIPPAYHDVWICPYANGHLQATGIDARGRKQYRYHPEWRSAKDTVKYHHVIAFGEALPNIRAVTNKHMAQKGLTREKVLATVVSLLEKTMIRVGNDEYAKTNQSYGLTTLQEKHVNVTGDSIRFKFKGKSGKEWNLKVTDRRIAKVVRACEEIDGQELFKYTDEEGEIHTISSSDVNGYLQNITGENFTAKDFRTWSGTVIASMALQEYETFDSQAQAKKNVVAAIEHVSQQLGNTPAVCRKCYVHPAILDAYLDGSFIAQISKEIDKTLQKRYDQGLKEEEIRVLQFLRRRIHKNQ